MLIREETLQFPFLAEKPSDGQRMGNYAMVGKGVGMEGGLSL